MTGSWTDKPIASISADATMEQWDLFNNFTTSKAIELLGPGKKSYNLRLACEELFSNIVRHAGSSSGPSNVKLSVSIFANKIPKKAEYASEIMVQISDTGPFFDPNFQTPRTIDQSGSVSNRTIGGLGLFLVQQSVDRAEYAWVNNTNRYRLFINSEMPPGSSVNNQSAG